MRVHLCGHALCHFSSVLRNYSAGLCRHICKAVRTIVDGFPEAIVSWMDNFQLFFITATTATGAI